MPYGLFEQTEQSPARFKPFAKLSKFQKLHEAKRLLRYSIRADRTFQKEAREDFAFHAGYQWTAEEKRILEQEEQRPCLTFDLIKPAVDLVMGVNEQNQFFIKAEPTEPNDEFLADILNDTKDKIYEIENIGDEEDDAFENAIICGRGFMAIDFVPDPKRLGELKINVISIPVHEIKLDPSGKKDDLSDHRHIFWEKWLTYEDFALFYPKYAKNLEDLISGGDGGFFEDIESGRGSGDIWDLTDTDTEYDYYNHPIDIDFYDKGQGRIRVVHMEYWDVYDRYYGFNPNTGQIEEFDGKNLKIIQKSIPDFDYFTIKDKRGSWFQFIGDKVLYDDVNPVPYDGFSIVSCFAFKDKSKGQVNHFGIVRHMKDPQREVNKRWSQTLNLLMKQGQGGTWAEIDAPHDKEQWEASINAPGETTWVNSGAIRDQKFMSKEKAEFPQASMAMQEASQDIMKKVSGINPDLLGISTQRAEPGVVIRMRQQQGLTLLARLFKAERKMKKQLVERLFSIIMAFMPDSQIQRILGQSERYIFRGNLVVDKENGLLAPLRNLRDLKYNINLEESPKNMSKHMFELSTYLEMISKGFPVDPKVVISKLDLPASDKQKWIQYIEQSQQSQQQMAQQQVMAKLQEMGGRLQLEQGKLQLDTQKNASDRDLELRKLDLQSLDDRRDYVIDLAKLAQEDRIYVMDLVAKMSERKQEKKQVNAKAS